jgi:hypothetical protein
MGELKNLERFTFAETMEGYVLHIAAEGGGRMDLAVTPDQLDAIIDALNELLGEDDDLFDLN